MHDQPANASDDARSILITGSSSASAGPRPSGSRRAGWRVFASMRDPERGRGAARPRRRARAGGSTTPALDVTSDDVGRRRRRPSVLRETGGRLDVLVNNAGYYAFGPLEETSPDELRAQLETNVVGVHRVTRAVLPAMRARRAGTVVSSGRCRGGWRCRSAGPYHASKWALEGMIEAWRLELSRSASGSR